LLLQKGLETIFKSRQIYEIVRSKSIFICLSIIFGYATYHVEDPFLSE